MENIWFKDTKDTISHKRCIQHWLKQTINLHYLNLGLSYEAFGGLTSLTWWTIVTSRRRHYPTDAWSYWLKKIINLHYANLCPSCVAFVTHPRWQYHNGAWSDKTFFLCVLVAKYWTWCIEWGKVLSFFTGNLINLTVLTFLYLLFTHAKWYDLWRMEWPHSQLMRKMWRPTLKH